LPFSAQEGLAMGPELVFTSFQAKLSFSSQNTEKAWILWDSREA
jgi:hypothetical protein